MTRTNLIEDLQLIPLPPWWQSPWAIIGFLTLLAALAAIVWVLRRWLASRPEAPSPPVARPDRVPEFLQRLEALRSQQQCLSAHDFALACSDILREFVEWQHHLAIRFQTTREFLEEAARNDVLAVEQRESLGDYLKFCDLVKFARQGATPDEETHLLDAAVSFVRQGGIR